MNSTGRWCIAHVEIDKPPVWLRRGTPASMSWCNLGTRTEMPGGWTRHNKGWVTEVSLLSAGSAAEPGARVSYINRSPQARPVASRAEAGEVIYGGGTIVRRNIGKVLGVR